MVPGMCVLSKDFGPCVVLYTNGDEVQVRGADGFFCDNVSNISYQTPSVLDGVVVVSENFHPVAGVICDVCADTAWVMTSHNLETISCPMNTLCLFDSDFTLRCGSCVL